MHLVQGTYFGQAPVIGVCCVGQAPVICVCCVGQALVIGVCCVGQALLSTVNHSISYMWLRLRFSSVSAHFASLFLQLKWPRRYLRFGIIITQR